jgi:short-subunit dehydrogenase
MTSLADKRVIVTGGSGGVGQLLAAELLRDGAEVAVLSRTPGEDVRTRHIAGDLSTLDGIATASLIVSREEPDLLVNMAGVQYFGPTDRQSVADMHAGYLINLVAPAALCRACLPSMRRRNAGHIVNVGSMLGSIALAHFAAYSSAKAGLRALSEALRRELADSNVAITYIAPRAIRTRMLNPELEKYARLTGMNIDPPSAIALEILAAIKRRRKELYIGFPERLFARLNAVLPRVVDAAVAGKDRRARALFQS